MQPEPKGCPGVGTEKAGKANACAGCPNQNLCSSNQTAANEDRERVVEKIKNIKNKFLILSGKGGVGKSTVTTLLSKYLAHKHDDLNFGVLDVDICGPSQPRMLGVENEQVHNSGSGWSPVNVEDNLCLMSIGFLLSSPDDAVIWRGPKKNGMIKQFLTEVDWGNLDYLILDTPPGTSDEHLSSVSYLNEPTGSLKAIIVTTPQEVALLDVRKQINFCKKLNLPILGVIENMSPFICGHCNGVSKIFDESTGGAKVMCKEMEVPFLGNLPLDAKLTQSCDAGFDLSILSEHFKNKLDQICMQVVN